MAIINLMDRLSEGKTRGIHPPKKTDDHLPPKGNRGRPQKKPMFEVFLAQKE